MKYDSLFEFTPYGMDLFAKAMTGEIEEDAVDIKSEKVARIIPNTGAIEVKDWATSRDMAAAVLGSMAGADVGDLAKRDGVWGWLSFIFRDVLYPRQADGTRLLRELHKWYPSNLSDFRKGQRHLVRAPVLLLSQLGENADHLLCTKPNAPGEVREQLTSQQDMFHPTFQAAARLLYFDPTSKKLKKGAGGKGAGASRRLARVRLQLDVTWDLFALSAEQLLEKLPKEFDKYRAAK